MTDKCNQAVYDKGYLVGIFDATKEQAELMCIKLSEETEYKHDWFYSAGRVVVKALPHSELIALG